MTFNFLSAIHILLLLLLILLLLRVVSPDTGPISLAPLASEVLLDFRPLLDYFVELEDAVVLTRLL